jgi:two-component system, NtrC family, nitrogen regulation sensor histidine kinase NtrY
MKFKDVEWRVLLRVLLLFFTLAVTAFLLVRNYVYVLFIVPVVLYQLVDFYRFHRKAHDELNEFIESVHYRDFSRNFDVKHAPVEVKPLRRGFNEINSTFKIISKEKETQYQYLQNILELVDTGIISYKENGGTVVWMNESLKKMLQLPYLKTIHYLARRDVQLYEQIVSLKPGENKIATAHLEKSSFKILLSATMFQTEGEKYKLIAFQNINEALDATESKAWQKLLSVMTHEIMNSVAPISSLADTLKNRMRESKNGMVNEGETTDDLELGIETIKRRSEGLLKFAETYRNLNKITSLALKKMYVRDMFENLHQLMQPTFDQKKIELEIVLKNTELAVEADSNLIEQVLINLLVNSIEAVKEKESPKITLSAYSTDDKKVIIKVADNGDGMTEDVIDKIFIPFFSTKKAGSGIGLSLCKQIMMLHRGNISVQSVPGKGTVMSLNFI